MDSLYTNFIYNSPQIGLSLSIQLSVLSTGWTLSLRIYIYIDINCYRSNSLYSPRVGLSLRIYIYIYIYRYKLLSIQLFVLSTGWTHSLYRYKLSSIQLFALSLHVGLSTCWTLYMLDSLHVGLSTCWTLYMLDSLHVGLSTCWTLYMLDSLSLYIYIDIKWYRSNSSQPTSLKLNQLITDPW